MWSTHLWTWLTSGCNNLTYMVEPSYLIFVWLWSQQNLICAKLKQHYNNLSPLISPIKATLSNSYLHCNLNPKHIHTKVYTHSFLLRDGVCQNKFKIFFHLHSHFCSLIIFCFFFSTCKNSQPWVSCTFFHTHLSL